MPALDNEQHELFCHEYLVDFNGAQAAIRAKYAKKAARQQACDLLTRPDICRRLTELMTRQSQKADTTAQKVLDELSLIAHADLGGLFDEKTMTMKTISDIPENLRRAIRKVEFVEEFDGTGEDRVQVGWTRKIELWDKNKALENLGRFHKLFTDVVQHKGLEGLSERMKAARERSKKR